MCEPYIDIELAREYVADAIFMIEDDKDFLGAVKLLELVLEIFDGDVSNVYSE